MADEKNNLIQLVTLQPAERSHCMNVGELRKALEGLHDDLPIVLRVQTGLHPDIEEDDMSIGGLRSAEMEYGCRETPCFMMDADDTEDDSEEASEKVEKELEKNR